MTVEASKYVESAIVSYLYKCSLTKCWLFNFNAVKNTEKFLRMTVLGKYSTIGIVISAERRNESKNFLEIAKKYNAVPLIYLSEQLPYDDFLVCVKE